MEVDNSKFWLMQMDILDGENSEESSKDMNLDDDNNGSDIQYFSYDVNTSKVNNVGVQFIEKMPISNTNVVQILLEHNYNSINDNTKKNNEDIFDSVIKDEISEQIDLSSKKPHTQDHIEVANSDYLDKNKSLKAQCSHCNKFFSKKIIKEHMGGHRGEGTDNCGECKKSFGKKYIKEHMRRHIGEGTYNCDKCKNCYPTPSELKRHYLTHDHSYTTDSNNPYIKIQCTYCKKFFSKSYIKMHEKEHRGETTQKCEVCEKVFRYASELKKHSKMHRRETHLTQEKEQRRETYLKVQCSHCNNFFGKNYIKEHRRRHNGEGTYNCGECKKSFHNVQNLKRHAIIHNPNDKSLNSQCFLCKKDVRKEYMKQHMRTHTGDCSYKVQCSCCNNFFGKKYIKEHMRRHSGEGTYNCGDCKKSFHNVHDLKRHAVIHNPNDQSFNSQCSYCKKNVRKEYMKEHMRRHRGERSYKCDKCKNCYPTPSELKRHYLTHDHSYNPYIKIQCTYCKKFFSKKYIKMHEKEHRGETKSLNSQCSYCKKNVRKKYMKQHMRRHRGECSYKCDKCKKYYQTPSELKKHYLRHEKEQRRETNVKCDVCEQTFTNYSELLNHIQMHSDNSYKCERSFSRNDLLEEHVKYSHIKKPIQRVSVIQKVADRKNDNPVTLSIQNKSKTKINTDIPHTSTYNTVGLLISANFLSREEIRENNADEIYLGSLNLEKLLKLKKFLADTLHDRIDKTEEIGNEVEQVYKIVRAKVVDQHLVLTNMDMDNSIKMERLMMEESEESCRDKILEDDYNFILDAEVAPEIRVLISLLILKNGFVCSYVGCLTTSRQRATLASHYMTHLGIKIKPFKCDWSLCEKHFSNLSALEQHKKNHINESVFNQFKCISCEETFRHRSKLEQHIFIHQELTTPSSLFRQEKEVEDIVRYGMEDHTNTSEEEDEVEVPPKKVEIVCSHQDCHLTFSSQWKLNMHKMSDH